MFFVNGSDYDNLREVYGEAEAFKRYTDKLGKLCVATVAKTGDTRLFVRSINSITDDRKKSGWWNTFTISKNPCDAGTYICKINDVRSDKNGYPIFVVSPVVRIDEAAIACDALMYVFARSGMFIEDYHGWVAGYNHQNLSDQVMQIGNVDVADGDNPYVAAFMEAVRLFINGTICRDQIITWLNEPSAWEVAEKAFENEVVAFFASAANRIATADAHGMATPCDFVLTAKKCLKFQEDRGRLYSEQKVAFIRDLEQKYQNAVAAGHISAVEDKTVWHQIEAYLVFDTARKQANKAAKTAAKKAKKSAANTGK